MRWTFLLLAFLAACPNPERGDDDDDDDDDAPRRVEELGTLTTTNSAGRSGAYFLPERAEGEALPLVLLFHPTGGNGASFRDLWVGTARERRFVLVAPDSRVSPGGDYTWEVGTDPGEVTPDLTHALDCLDEVLDLEVSLEAGRVLAAGHSGGASSAPYVATNDDRFSHFSVLHGGLFVGGFGEGSPAAWLSTGADDTIRPPAELEGYATQLEGLGFDVTIEIFAGGHGLSATEIEAIGQWWLD